MLGILKDLQVIQIEESFENYRAKEIVTQSQRYIWKHLLFYMHISSFNIYHSSVMFLVFGDWQLEAITDTYIMKFVLLIHSFY